MSRIKRIILNSFKDPP